MPGALRTYLGSAPGVGKTYAMLVEGNRRSDAGERVVVGWLERHGRVLDHRGVLFDDLDVEAVIASGAGAALVDELAHTSADGTRRRWEDVADLLDGGMDVLTTLNVANLVSVRDYAAQLTGAGTVESVPDELVRAGEVVVVDIPPEALRRRIASGLVYSAEVMGGALADYFRVSNLEALSALAQAWVDDTLVAAGDELLRRRGRRGLGDRPTVVAGVSDSAWGSVVIARAAQLAEEADADLVVAHVELLDGFTHATARLLGQHCELTRRLGGTYLEVAAADVAAGLADVVRSHDARWVVVARHRSWLSERTRGSVAGRLRRRLPDVEVVEVRSDDAAVATDDELATPSL